MNWDDVVYLILLFFSIGFGQIIRVVDDKSLRKNLSTLVGVSIILITSGKHSFHIFLATVVNWLILLFSPRKKVHIYAFVFSFSYLLFSRLTEYFGIPFPPSHTNLIQMILTLKLVGLAFEIHDSEAARSIDKPTPEHEYNNVSVPHLIEMFHYAFCYAGVLAGPYFSYKSFRDWFHYPFYRYAPCEKVTLERAKWLPLYAVGFILSSYIFPLQYCLTDEFYSETTLFYRLFYLFPTFFAFRMRMYIGMRLAECVFTMAGIGAYPVVSKPRPGAGPTTDFQQILPLAREEGRAKVMEYSFESVYNIEPEGAELEYTVRSSMKHWNMTVQYWLVAYVYKRCPVKAYRTPVTFLVSSFWHGVYAGHYLCLCSVPFYLPIEDIYIKNLKHLPQKSAVIEKCCFAVAYTWRMFLMGYWSIAFSLLQIGPALHLWSSIYFIPTLITLIMLGVGRFIFKPTHGVKVD